MPLHLIGKAKDLRTTTFVLYGQASVADYLKLVGETFDEFDIQRKRERHRAYRRMKQDIAAGALLPLITLAVRPDIVSDLLPLVEKDDFACLATALSKPGQVNILDGLQRTLILREMEKEGTVFKPGQTVHLEIWLEQNIHNFIYRVLVLNAGQKPMSIRHQFKLIFLSLKNRLEYDIPGLHIYTEIQGKRQERSPGMYTLNSIIIAYLSFLMKTPEISRDNIAAQEMARQEIFDSNADELSRSFEIFKDFLFWYKALDENIHRIYTGNRKRKFPAGKDGYGTENVMNCFFSSVALVIDAKGSKSDLDKTVSSLIFILKKSSNSDDPLSFKTLRSLIQAMDPRKTNIGYAVRKLIFMGFVHYFLHRGKKPFKECWNEAAGLS